MVNSIGQENAFRPQEMEMMNLRKFGWLFGFAAMMISQAWNSALAAGSELKLSECPVAVQKTFQREANGAKIDEVEKEIEDGKTTYEADVTIDGKKYDITVAENGMLLEKALEEDEDADEGKKGEEVKVKLSDCPAAVQKTLKCEANGAKIEAVDKETKGGKIVFEVDVKIDGKNYEIRVAEDGILISKALDEEDE
jgi:uncharacterized membrane protein YkoI